MYWIVKKNGYKYYVESYKDADEGKAITFEWTTKKGKTIKTTLSKSEIAEYSDIGDEEEGIDKPTS